MYAFQNTNPQSFYEKSQQAKNRALSAYSSYDRSQKSEGEAEQNIPKTVGGALSTAAGTGLMGYQIGSMSAAAGAGTAGAGGAGLGTVSALNLAGGPTVTGGTGAAASSAAGAAGSGAVTGSSAGWWGAGIGAAVGLLLYWLS